MKKLTYFIAGLLLAISAATFATLKSDITTQGTVSWLHGTLTDQQLSATVRDWEIVTAANTIAYTECGKTFFLNSATEFASTLPGVATAGAGCYFKFVVKAAPASADYTIVTGNTSENVIVGGVNELEVDDTEDGPTAVVSSPGDTISLKDGVAVVGDWVEMITDGTYWYVTGQTNADGGVTFTST